MTVIRGFIMGRDYSRNGEIATSASARGRRVSGRGGRPSPSAGRQRCGGLLVGKAPGTLFFSPYRTSLRHPEKVHKIGGLTQKRRGGIGGILLVKDDPPARGG